MTASTRQARDDRQRDLRAQAAAQSPARTVSIELGGERAAIVEKIRRPNETIERAIGRLIDQARPKDLDIGTPV